MSRHSTNLALPPDRSISDSCRCPATALRRIPGWMVEGIPAGVKKLAAPVANSSRVPMFKSLGNQRVDIGRSPGLSPHILPALALKGCRSSAHYAEVIAEVILLGLTSPQQNVRAGVAGEAPNTGQQTCRNLL